MPIVSVGRDKLFKALGKTYGKLLAPVDSSRAQSPPMGVALYDHASHRECSFLCRS